MQMWIYRVKESERNSTRNLLIRFYVLEILILLKNIVYQLFDKFSFNLNVKQDTLEDI